MITHKMTFCLPLPRFLLAPLPRDDSWIPQPKEAISAANQPQLGGNKNKLEPTNIDSFVQTAFMQADKKACAPLNVTRRMRKD